MLKQTGIILSLVATITLLASLSLSLGEQPATAADERDGQHVSNQNSEPPPPAKTGDPKLRSHLDDLIIAHERGEAEEYARPRDIKLLDGGKVRVSIRCVPGQVKAAVEIADTLGTVELVSRRGSVQVVVPLSSLALLAEAESIRSVELPIPPEEEVVSQGVGLIKADLWYDNGDGYDGTGVKIGILDTGFSGYAALE